MNFARTIFGFAIMIGLAFLLGKVKHEKNPEGYAYSWGGAIVILLLLRWYL